jgi:hypothetical protein
MVTTTFPWAAPVSTHLCAAITESRWHSPWSSRGVSWTAWTRAVASVRICP